MLSKSQIKVLQAGEKRKRQSPYVPSDTHKGMSTNDKKYVNNEQWKSFLLRRMYYVILKEKNWVKGRNHLLSNIKKRTS